MQSGHRRRRFWGWALSAGPGHVATENKMREGWGIVNSFVLPRRIKRVVAFVTAALVILGGVSCRSDHRLDDIVVHDTPLIGVESVEVLLGGLSNPAAIFIKDDRMLFAESGKGVVYEYKRGNAAPLIDGFGTDSYERYEISVLGLMAVPNTPYWIVAASQDTGHIFLFDETTFPTTADKGREIELQRTESHNPFGLVLAKKGSLLVASGGTKSVYQGRFDVIDPGPLKPVFDVDTGVEGMAEDANSGDIFGAVVGTGKNDGSLVRWDPASDKIEPRTLATGFTNLVGVMFTPGGMLLLLEFGSFDEAATGRLSVMDPADPTKVYPLVTGLDSPSGFALGPDNTLAVSTFGKRKDEQSGMLIKFKLVSKLRRTGGGT